MKKILTIAVGAAAFLCLSVTPARAQFDDNDALFADDPWSYPDDTPAAAPSSTPAADTWDYSDEPEPAKAAPAAKPAKPVKPAKPEKAPKAAKPAKAPKAAVSADDGMLNVFANIGAGFGIGGYYVGAMSDYIVPIVPGEVGLKSKEDHYINLGEGLRFEIGVGYMVAPSLEGRLSVDMNFGIFAPTTGGNGTPGNPNVKKEDTVNTYYSWGVKLMLVPQFEMLELFDAYIGGGMSLNFAGSSYKTTREYSNDDPTYKTEFDRDFSPAIGFCGVIGGVIPFSDAISFFAELQFEVRSFTLNELKYVSHSGGSNPTSSKPFEKDSPLLDAPPLFPGTSWGLRVGMKYWLM